jgi:two-component sensor histidine kinase
LGLIINELVVNSLKYAFPNGQEGGVIVEFVRRGKEYSLRVSDDGVGISPSAGAAELKHGSAGLGQRLVKSFVAQLGGRLEIESRSPGTTVLIWFPVSQREGRERETTPALKNV